MTVIISKSSWYRHIGQAELGLRPLFRKPSVAQPQFGKMFRVYTTLGRVRSLGDGRYLAETGQIIDASDLPASARVRLNPRWDAAARHLAGAGFAFGVSASFQWVEDWNDPYLTPKQQFGRVVVSGAGGVIAWGAGQLVSGAVAGSWAGPVGIVVGAGTTFVWIKWMQPVIFDAFDLNPERALLPLQD